MTKRNENTDMSVCGILRAHIEALSAAGRHSTAGHFRSTLSALLRFGPGEAMAAADITGDFCQAFERWLRRRGLCRNTTSFYLRCLRVVHTIAVEQGAVADRRPFAHVFTGCDTTRKRALTHDELRRVCALDLRGRPVLQMARDMFLFSFYCRGMSLVDMARLQRRDLRRLTLTYSRSKTGRTLTIDWLDELQAIAARYADASSPLLLPVLGGSATSPVRPAHKSAGQRINRALRQVAALAGVPRPFTLYAARHTWATLARDSGASPFVLQTAMGHANIRTTQIYLASLDTAAVDDLARTLAQSLR